MSTLPVPKAGILALFQETHTSLKSFIAELSEAAKIANGTSSQWAAKNYVGDIAFWMDYMVERMEFYVRGEAPPRYVEFSELFQDAFEHYKDDTWGGIEGSLWRAHAKLVAEVGQFSEAQLSVNNAYGDHPGGMLWHEILANGYIYPLQQLAKYFVQHGDLNRATSYYEQMVAQTPVLGNVRKQGQALYGLAAFYAANGQPAKALDILPEALRLAPDSAPYLTEDTDFDALRSNPAFQRLLA